VVGRDGPTHHGIYVIPMLRCLPNLVLMQPKDTVELVGMLKAALAHNGPAAIRYPRDPGPAVTPPPVVEALELGRAEVVVPAPESGPGAVGWLWALGDVVPLACETAARLAASGVRAGVVNARFVKPLDVPLLTAQAAGAALIATLENGAVAGGFGSAVREALASRGLSVPVETFGWPDEFVGQGTTSQLMADYGLVPERVSAAVLARL
jgi:1-deoxy-D-xylulose-5-phosphate synthase